MKREKMIFKVRRKSILKLKSFECRSFNFQIIFMFQKCPKYHITICLSSDQNAENSTCRIIDQNRTFGKVRKVQNAYVKHY